MEGSSSDRSTPKVQTIVLNVLSPSTEEVPKKLTFADIPISTTVRALKERIQTTVPARPPLLRQRLIYQGKVLASEETSLKDVFGQEAINRSEPLSLHLVLSPAPKSHTPTTSASSTPNQAPQSTNRQQWMPSLIPQLNNPSSNGQTPQPNQQGASPGAPNVQQGPGQTPPGPNILFPPPQMAGQQGQTPMPPHLQNALNSHLAAMNQQFAAHFAAHGQQHHLHQGPPHTHFQAHQWQQPTLPQPSFQQIIAQQQQARAAAGQYGLSPDLPTNQTPAEQNGQGSDNAQASNQSPNPNTAVRENQGPNGESFRVVIQSISRPNSGMSQRPHSRASSYTPQRSSTPTNIGIYAPPNTAAWGAPGTGNPSYNSALNLPSPNPLAMFQQRLSAIETSLAGGTAPPQAVFDHARTYLDNMASQPNMIPHGLEAPLRTRLNNLTTQADHLRASLNSVLSQVLASQQSASGLRQANGPQALSSFPTGSSQTGQPLAQGGPSSNTAAPVTPSGVAPTVTEPSDLRGSNEPSAAPEVYLLSSPVGPHSLLVHHSGLYTTNLTLPLMTGIPQLQSPNFSPFSISHATPSQQAPHNSLNPQAPQNPPNQPPGVPAPMNIAQAQAHQHQHQQQQQGQNQPRDLARILLPLGGHLWLLIRLFGFVYFFTAGGGHRRAILLGICAFIVFIANTGAFRPLFRAIWEPIRRHVEGLIPLAAAGGGREGNRQQQGGQQQQQQQGRIEDGAEPDRNGPNAGANTAPNTNRPDPRALADRLLRDQANASLFRRAERAVALFVASLVPGVGERHIAARDAAEARRVEEEMERQVRASEARAAQEERGTDRSEAQQIQRENLQEAPGGGGLGGSSSGVEGGLHGTGEGSGGGDEGMREREPRDGPLVEI
ncbi:MAG: hypothetical protein L6R38_002082 [Xanthoria sp. 2 TBL-2021]|nr:MAG: hypothetical protein L6R38_002082 [Xanthoria sp. 2 TBL-2021]